MIYNLSVSAPKDTTQFLPASETVQVVAGDLSRLLLTFPDGCVGLVGARVKANERVIFPTNADQWFVNNNFTFDFEERLTIDGDGLRFTLEVYNEDAVYEHTVYMQMVILPPARTLLSDLLAMTPGAGAGDLAGLVVDG